LDEARRDHLELRRNVKGGTLLLDCIEGWTHRIEKSLSTVGSLTHVREGKDIPAFFDSFVKSVNKFLDGAHAEMPDTRLVKMTTEAVSRVHAEQQRVLLDKEFVRSNCRIYPSMDLTNREETKRGKKDGTALGEEELELEFISERERLKSEATAAENHLRALKASSPQRPDRRRTRTESA